MQWPTAPADASPDNARLAPIRIFTDDLELHGFVAPGGRRVTDLLHHGDRLDFLPVGAADDPGNWVAITPSEILMVSPPPLDPRRLRWPDERDLRTVSLRVGEYRVRGTIHLQPGGELSFDLYGRQAFLPLTSAELSRGTSVERLDVVIVNLARSGIES